MVEVFFFLEKLVFLAEPLKPHPNEDPNLKTSCVSGYGRTGTAVPRYSTAVPRYAIAAAGKAA